ncbi:hypothetical protein GGQ84_002381 [Desulfitispora alkaliphila]|uniref:gluconate 2-dehydrogenase subunit 3 family protein n=1 Tax=Desulfitispora alkaliphila TaxID=622674 RepID=UPI003D1C7F55
MEKKTHYPDFDVLSLKEEWDDNTREVVLKRLGPFPAKNFLSEDEEKLLRVICSHMVYDNRDDIFDWVLYFIDQRLHSEIGESHRKPNMPAEKNLIRLGLQAINKVTQIKNGKSFINIDVKEQFQILASLQLGKVFNMPEWKTVPQKDLFKKLQELIVGAYYSHPIIWSEIGYGGPAYPRGYYRLELGWADPWEPKMGEPKSQGFHKEARKDGK